MNMNVSKTNGVKLLAAVMVMAMVFAGAAVVLSDSEVNAVPTNTEGMINLQDYEGPGDGYSFESGTGTLTLDGYKGTQGFYYNDALKIIVEGENSITVTTDANAAVSKAFAAIYTTSGAITIEGDNVDKTTDKLTITVNGATTGDGGSEWTYGIYSPAGLTISDIAVDIDVATSDAYAFAIEGNGDTSFTNVTGSIDGGNRAIQVGNHTFTFTGCDLTLTGGEKAIQAKNENSQVIISSGTIRALLNPNYGGPQVGENDGFGVKATKLTVSSGATLIADGIRISSEEVNSGAATATLNGNVTINDYSYAFSSDVNVNGYTPGFTMDAKSTTTIGSTGKVVNNSTIISKGALTNGGNLTNNGAMVLASGSFTNNGTTTGNPVLNQGVVIDGDKKDDVSVVASDSGDNLGLKGTLLSDYTVPDANYLSDDLVIAEGVTLTISSRGSLDLGTHTLTVNGTLLVERNGVITAYGGGVINLSRTGSIENSGIIGSNSPVAVGVDGGVGQVKMNNVTGVSFDLVRSGSAPNYTYTLGVSGDVGRASGTTAADEKVLSINGAIVNGNLTTSRDVTLNGTFSVARNGVVTTNGPMAGTATLQNGAEFSVAGAFTGTINAQTNEAIASDNTNPTYENATFTSTNTDDVTVTNFTVSVSRVQYSNEGAVYFHQRAYLSGNIGLTSTSTNAAGILTVSGNTFVASGETVVLANKVTLSTPGSSYLIVEGTIQNIADYSDVNYVGAFYTVTPEGQTNGVGYITNFDAAMSAIATADATTITVSGLAGFETEITGSYALDMDEIVQAKSGSAPLLVIDEAGVITVNDGAVLENAAIKDIEGMVVVIYGGDCTPDGTKYDVQSTNEDGDITYAGLQVVLNNAQPGDEITIDGTTEIASVNVPNGVKLTVNGTLDVERSVTVAEGGVLNVTGTLNIGKAQAGTARAIPGTLTVNGTADITEGTLTMVGGTADAKTTVTSTGSLIYSARNNLVNGNTAAVNGAYYSGTDGFVLTTVSKAVAGAIETETMAVTVIGTVSDTTDVVLGGVRLTIEGTVTLGNVDIQSSNVFSTTGTLTATLVGQSGIDGSTTQSAVQLTAAKIASVTNTAAINAQNENVWTFTLGAVTDGSVTISQGTVVIGNVSGSTTGTNNPADKLTVASGATMVVPAAGATVQDISIAVDGTVEINGTLNVTVVAADKETFTIAGTVTVNGTLDVTGDVTVTGTLTVTDNETTRGTASVDNLIVGEASETLGATGTINGLVTLGTNGYALAYPGTTVAATNFGSESAVKSTQFYINGALYVTAYATGNAPAIGAGGFMADVKITGFVTTDGTTSIINTATNWSEDEAMETKLNSSVFNVGDKDAVYIQLAPANAGIKYSVGTGISLYVDGIRVDSSSVAVPISVGTHTVTATVNPGYAGEVTITFNGQTITGGTFEVTPEMAAETAADVVLSVTGNISVDTGSTGSSDDGMGLTEILLVILVILIVVMAIMVALRLMRS